MTSADRIGFIGLGDIGAPMARQILNAGFRLAVWNRTASKMEALRLAGAETATSPAELSRASTIICTCVDSATALDDILFGRDGVTSTGASLVEIVIDHSTLSPPHTTDVAERLAHHNIGFLDVPVSGGAVGARAGTLAAMAGGDPQLLERARPVIATFASRITHMGPVGAGQAAKACNQIINFGNMAALAEALALAPKYGISPERVPEAIAGGFADSNIAREFHRSLVADDFSPVRFLVDGLRKYYSGYLDPDYEGKLGILLKDLGIALDMGRAAEVPLPGTSHFDAIFRMLQSRSESDEHR